MTVRVPRTALALDQHMLAALLTHALLSPANDDAPEVHVKKVGVAWLRWGDVLHRCRGRFD